MGTIVITNIIRIKRVMEMKSVIFHICQTGYNFIVRGLAELLKLVAIKQTNNDFDNDRTRFSFSSSFSE